MSKLNNAEMIDRQMTQIEQNKVKRIELVQLTENHYFIGGFANVGVVMTDEGVVIIDTNTSKPLAKEIYEEIRTITDLPIRYIIYTHGHWDHVHAADVFKEEGTKVIAHENVINRFYKYQHLNEYTYHLNNIQFQGKLGITSYNFIRPDIIFSNDYHFSLGGKTFHLVHGKGETDDHCFVHIPEDGVIYSGDFFVSSFPNIGNPLKVNRFEKEWYETLEKILALQPIVLSPGHGRPMFGKDNISEALQPVIEVLQFIHKEVFRCLNEGLSLEAALNDIKLPPHLENNEYLQQIYGCLEFAIKGTYRRYSGWYDGNPTNLQPANEKDIFKEMIDLIVVPKTIINRCNTLMEEENYQMVLHLTDILIATDDNNQEARELKKEALQQCANKNGNFIMRNIYRDSLQRL